MISVSAMVFMLIGSFAVYVLFVTSMQLHALDVFFRITAELFKAFV